MRHEGKIRGATYVAEAPGGPRILSWSAYNDERRNSEPSIFASMNQRRYNAQSKAVRWWDAASGERIGEPMRHDRSVTGATYVAAAPGGPRVLSWSIDHTVRWWDAASGAEAAPPLHFDRAPIMAWALPVAGGLSLLVVTDRLHRFELAGA
jgi:hypothetical protein